MLKKRNFWISLGFAIALCAVLYPYHHDMYIADLFTAICALLNLGTAVVLSVLLYLALEKRFPEEEIGIYALYLLLFGGGHALFAMMSWGSWVFLGLSIAALGCLWYSWHKAHPRPKNSKRKWYCLLVALILVGIAACWNSPVLRVKLFLTVHGDTLQQRIESLPDLKEGEEYRIFEGMPGNMGFSRMWIRQDGQNTIVEFLIMARGLVPSSTYSGCYYSLCDLPAAYEPGTELVQNGPEEWSWQADGDNHGITRKLSDGWYYFEASF